MLLTTLPWVRILSVLSSEQRLSQFHSLYHSFLEYSFSLYHSFASRLQIIPQLTLLSASSRYAGTVFRFQISMSVSSRPSRLCRFTAAYLFLVSLVGHDLVSKPISFCLEEVLIVTGFVPGLRLPDGFSGTSGSGAAGADTDFAPLWAQPGRNRFRFRRPSLPNQPSTSPGASARLLSQLGSHIGRQICRTYSFNNFWWWFCDWVLDPSYRGK